MIQVTINPDKSWTLTFGAGVQTAIDAITAVRGAQFWEGWLNAKFSEMTRRVKQIKADEVQRKFVDLPEAKQQQIRDILEGRS